jgi:predicted phosphodiesterase
MRVKRSAWLWCLCILLVVQPGGAWSQTTSRPAERPSFTFAVITDTHIADAAELGRFRAFLQTIQDRRVDFLLILGDLCGHAPEYLPQMREVIEHSGLTVYPIPGNHDDNYGRHPEWYDGAFKQSYYAFDHKGWRFVMSDSQIPPPAEWLERELAAGGGKQPTVFCQHYPPIPKLGETQMPWAELVRHANVKLVLTGHEHRRSTRQFGTLRYEVLDKCFFTKQKDPGCYYLVQVSPDVTTRISEYPLQELNLREPADRTPSVAIAAPLLDQTLRNGTVMRGTADDDKEVRRVECCVDWGKWQAAKGTREWQYGLDTTALQDGHHMLRARAIDSAGQPSITLAEVMVLVENHRPETGRMFRFQQGVDGYEGCQDVTVRRGAKPKSADGHEGETSDLECWVWDKGQGEFSESYIRFDLSKAPVPKEAKIKRATLTLYGSRQNQVDPDGKACKYYLGVMREPWQTSMTFQTRPDKPGWFVQVEPEVRPDLVLAWPYLGGRQTIMPPQPVVIDLTPLKAVVQGWLREPEGNHGLVISPGPGKPYDMSAKGSRCEIVSLRPKLEIEIER